MKKTMVLLLAVLLTISAVGCGKNEPKIDPDSSFAADFTDKLYAIQQNYHSGTAGCSLRAAALAAEIMDIFTQSDPSEKLIKNTVKEFAETLSGDEAKEFPSQIDAIIEASDLLTKEDGKGLLDDCGYNGQGYPWNADRMTKCFAAMKLG